MSAAIARGVSRAVSPERATRLGQLATPGSPDTADGATLHGELGLLVRAGLGPGGSADHDHIAPGLRANLLVSGDPTHDITNTRDIVAVWCGGHRLNRAPLPYGTISA